MSTPPLLISTPLRSTPTGEFAAAHGSPSELERRVAEATDVVRSGAGGRLESFEAEGVTVHHCDCMELMRATPDGAFDLAIVDPPYGIGDRLVDGGGTNVMIRWQTDYRRTSWDVAPSAEYFRELFRVSRAQIVCGGNYFALRPTRGVIAWDKKVFVPSMSRWEMFWTSFDCPARLVELSSMDAARIHPTQKPVGLYGWLLANYAKRGQRVLDTHFGSGSIAIAARNFGCELVACEIDADYFAASTARIARDFSQQMLFSGGGADPVGESQQAFAMEPGQTGNAEVIDRAGDGARS